MRDVERLETQMDGVRSYSQRAEEEFDLTKKILVFERELSQYKKE